MSMVAMETPHLLVTEYHLEWGEKSPLKRLFYVQKEGGVLWENNELLLRRWRSWSPKRCGPI